MGSPDALLTTGAVARRFDVDSGTVRRWVERGFIPHLRLPSGQLRFRLADVERAVAAMEPAAVAAAPDGSAA